MAVLFFRQEWVFSCYSQHIHEDTQLLGRFSLYWGGKMFSREDHIETSRRGEAIYSYLKASIGLRFAAFLAG